MAVETKIEFDMTEFNKLTKQAPGVIDKLTGDSFNRGVAKLRKEFHKTIDTIHFQQLESTPEYYPGRRPLSIMKPLIRYKLTRGRNRITAMAGVFPGKAGRSNIRSGRFKQTHGVTLARFARVMTYGGKLKVTTKNRRTLVRRGFYIAKRTKFVSVPKRDWFNKTKWTRPSIIIPYIQRDFDERVSKWVGGFRK